MLLDMLLDIDEEEELENEEEDILEDDILEDPMVDIPEDMSIEPIFDIILLIMSSMPREGIPPPIPPPIPPIPPILSIPPGMGPPEDIIVEEEEEEEEDLKLEMVEPSSD